MNLQLYRQLSRVPSVANLNRRFLTSTARANRAYVRFEGPQSPGRQNSGRWDPRLKGAALAIAVGGVIYVSHLEQVPETGRWRFMSTSPESEAKLGESMRKELRRELAPVTLPPNHRLSIHVRRVVSRILEANNLGVLREEVARRPVSMFGALMDPSEAWNPDAHFGDTVPTNMAPVYGPQKSWDVIVVDDSKMVNAMASPGLIVVYTGILPVCQDEEGLAAVLSHEIGHVVARHTAERISSQTITWGILILLTALFGVDLSLTNILQKYLLQLPNSRTQETEADIIGMHLMSKACYDPAASPQMFARLGRVEAKIASQINLDFFRTHPSSENRIKILQERLPEGYAIMAENPRCDQIRGQLDAFKQIAHPMRIRPSGELVMS